ncbi:hypothetical protein IAR50_005182 [Cryptococcus sp. DSM 104548]
MSSQAPQQSSYRDRSPRYGQDPRESRRGDYQRDHREAGGRARSRSPTRSRYDDSHGRDYRDRDSDRSDRRYRDFDGSARRQAGGYERDSGRVSDRREGGERRAGGRDWEQERVVERQRERENPNNDPNYRPRHDDRIGGGGGGRGGYQGSSARGGRGGFVAGRGGGGQYGGDRGGYGGGGGWDGRERDFQSMDRRAIEEGRRRREEERAMGVGRTEDGRVVNPRDMDGGREAYGKTEFFERDEQDEGEVEDEQDETEAQMAAMMGFGGFNTTKKKNVQQNVEGGANVHKERTWRQYMNRRGGFNRPLDKVKD